MLRKNNPLFLLLSCFFLLASCSKSPLGAGTEALNKTYKQIGFQRTVYSQSMIRAAANVAKLDSNHLLTQNIEYVMQFKLKKDARYYNAKADSTILWSLADDGLEAMATYEEPKSKMYLFLKNDAEIVQNVVFIRSDTANYELMEFVGEMPMKIFITEGWNNIENFQNILNLNVLPDVARDFKNN